MKILLVVSMLIVVNSINAQNTYPFPSSGAVGIGTATPAIGYLLDVRGNIYIRTPSPGIRLWDHGGASQSVMDIGSSEVDGAYIGANYGTAAVPMTLNVVGSSHMLFKTNSMERMRISSAGYLGIGTTTPAYPLDVNGNMHVASNIYFGSASYPTRNMFTQGFQRLTAPNDLNTLDISVSNSEINIANNFFGGGSPVPIKISTYSRPNQLYLSTNGFVGIGTDSVTEKLCVNGNIRTKKVIVTQTGWSDYVFNDNYELRTLFSLEKFIKQNKYLPEMPTAKEVKENGISVGDNQALLLKKIEELTLYIINQQKQLDKQAKDIQFLKSKK